MENTSEKVVVTWIMIYHDIPNSPHFSFVTDEDLRGQNVLHIDSIATCSLETDHLFYSAP